MTTVIIHYRPFQNPTDVHFATSARCIIACNYGLALHPFGLSGVGKSIGTLLF